MRYHCSNCKGSVKEGDRNCPKCGAKLIWKKQYLKETEAKKEKIEEISPRQKSFLGKEIPKWKEKNIGSMST